MSKDINKSSGSSTDTSDFLFSYLVTNGRAPDDIHEIDVRVSHVGNGTLSIAGCAVDAASVIKDLYPNVRVELLSFRPLTKEESKSFNVAIVAADNQAGDA
ncbi:MULTISPECIES: hypothetical protein [Symbiopectobacterium]|uniref:hypothetical protein n=1 Tax=Symbiopectobacterium TaxID=801 RepID=UPI001A22A881|nr:MULTISPECIES: hypothetical protein [Symbiopectobacterium]MBG6247009.1 hypothetical protein [Candidatus Symbiopectobacterium sp. PLON1]MBT9429080.1 hypothetical protein [Candidatus Symbiopectobacterium endolongispinus]